MKRDNSIIRMRKRRKFYFTNMRDSVAHENLSSLRFASIASEIFLALMGVFSAFVFNNMLLNTFFLIFLICDSFIILYSGYLKRSKTYSYDKIQLSCMVFVFLVMGFITCISIFPSKTDVAIYWSLSYILMLILFHFSIHQTIGIYTGFTVIFCILSVLYKSQYISPYNIISAAVTWICGFIFLYISDDLRLKNGELRYKLEEETVTDYLTGLYNRRGMDMVFNKAFKNCKLSNVSAALFIIDIDDFKKYNDRFGHVAGDSRIAHVGKALLEYTEETGTYAARYGGEEFALFFAGCDESDARQRGNQLLNRLCYLDSRGNTLSVSIGAAVKNATDTDTLDRLFKRADNALYNSKNSGKNRFTLDNKKIHSETHV